MPMSARFAAAGVAAKAGSEPNAATKSAPGRSAMLHALECEGHLTSRTEPAGRLRRRGFGDGTGKSPRICAGGGALGPALALPKGGPNPDGFLAINWRGLATKDEF